jgi:type IX secretion system PorP/SprF family membrane protein
MTNTKSQVSGIRYQALSPKPLVIGKFKTWILFGIWNLGLGTWSFCQQMPYYTQFKSNGAFLNPAVVGTKRLIDARINYRKQWVGFDEAPVTEGFSLNSRMVKGTMGLGINYFNDKTGPTKRSDLGFAYSYHGKFDDVELSAGLAYERLTYVVDGTKLNMHMPFDNVIDLSTTQKKSANDASAGLLLYNDRFHIGLSVLNLLEPTINYYPEDDPKHRTRIHMVPHIYASAGYNWSGQPDWIWENSLQVLYAQANPMTIDYNLRLHYLQKVFAGISIRLKDAVAFHIGATFYKDFHISYSYDLIISSMRYGQSGSHEFMLVWSTNLGNGKKNKYDNSRFQRQKYGFMF